MATIVDPLHLSLQNIDDLLSSAYWSSVCPFLTCSIGGIPAEIEGIFQDAIIKGAGLILDYNCDEVLKDTIDADLDNRRQLALTVKGFFKVEASCTGILPATLLALEKGVSIFARIEVLYLPFNALRSLYCLCAC
jgi:hypothetical protein